MVNLLHYRLAPNFDNNLSLISRNTILNQDVTHEGFIHSFVSFLRKNKIAYSYYKEMEVPILNEEMIDDIFSSISIKEDEIEIKKFIINRYNYLVSIRNK